MKISQETPGSDWQWDLRTFVLMHNSTPHSTPGIAPSILMFGRKLKDKLPGLMTKGSTSIEKFYDRDLVQKTKGADYADNRRRAKPNDLDEGDIVIAKRMQKENKLSTTFDPEEYIVVSCNGSDVTLKSRESDRVIHRNVSHLKKLFSDGDPISEAPETVIAKELVEPKPPTTNGTSRVESRSNQPGVDVSSESAARPKRKTEQPSYLKDYKVNNFV